MSKKKKVSPVKNGKKKPANKPVKKAAKPVAMIKKAKKSLAASPKKKTTQKPAAKVAGKKPAPAKRLIKKVVKTVQKVVKSVMSKKPAGKTPPAKSVSKVEKAKSTPVKPSKVVETKNGADKKLKSHIQVNPPEFKKEVKKDLIPAAEKAKKTETPGKSGADKKSSNDVLAITNTIPVKAKSEISMSKIASIARSITNPVKKTDSYAVRPEKEPAGKFEMEFVVHSSAEMLYEFLSTPSGLSEWFCDDLNIRNGIYTFIWDDQLQQARLLKTVDLQLVRFQWVDKTDGSYFEFRIQRDDLTNDIALIITDFADSASDRESSKLLWHSQIEKLMHVIGSIF